MNIKYYNYYNKEIKIDNKLKNIWIMILHVHILYFKKILLIKIYNININ